MLNISRTSVVNIEAGRQHAPLHLLWQIAEILGIDVLMLIPNQNELLLASAPMELNKTMLKHIEMEAKDNPELQASLKTVVEKLLSSIEVSPKVHTRS